MLTEFISITNLQRNMKKVFQSKKPMFLVMSNNAVSGLVISKETAKMLMESGVLDQIREEIEELNDPETRDVMMRIENGDITPVPFDDFAKEYGV
jgi:hypothetical protein